MAITRTDRNQVFDRFGTLVGETVITVDITAPTIRNDLHARARTALVDNAAYLAITSPTNAQNLAQIRRLTRQHNAIIRLLLTVDGSRDLLVESTDV